VLASAVDGGATYVMYTPDGHPWLGVRTAAGRYLPAEQLWMVPPNDPRGFGFLDVFTGARLLVHNGHWQAFWSGWTFVVRGFGLSGAWTRSDTTRYARTPAGDSAGDGHEMSIFQVDAGQLPDGRTAVLLADSGGPKISFGVSGPRGWTFSDLHWPVGPTEKEFQVLAPTIHSSSRVTATSTRRGSPKTASTPPTTTARPGACRCPRSALDTT
jgi:hypothetical protein